MGKLIDLTGRRFGRLLIVDRAKNGHSGPRWNYLCDCGTVGDVYGRSLLHADQRSCGCLQREAAAEVGRSRSTHGATSGGGRTPEYQSWRSMRERVLNTNHHAYYRYGGRGITICDRWLHGDAKITGFECFLIDMGPRPEGTSIDRINTNGPYAPDNCRWTTAAVQARNATDTKMSGIDVGILKSMAANDNAALSTLATKFGISKQHAWRIKTGERWAA